MPAWRTCSRWARPHRHGDRPPRPRLPHSSGEQGYREALHDAGLAVDETLLRLGAFQASHVREAARALLRLPDPPTAIFACNDLAALATLEAAAELGVDVPGRLSVLGFDNVPESATAQPPLTTVQQLIRQMGHDAVVTLVAVLAGREPGPTHVTLGTTLVVRRSTAPPGRGSPAPEAAAVPS